MNPPIRYLLVLFAILRYFAGSAQIDSLPVIAIPSPVFDNVLVNPGIVNAVPDTLHFQDYVLVVERYTNSGRYDKLSGIHSGLAGYGRVLFQCIRRPVSSPFDFGTVEAADISLIPFALTVVDKVEDIEKEIALQDARQFDVDIQRGNQLQLMLPTKADIRQRYISDQLDRLRKRPVPNGIRFSFSGVNARRSKTIQTSAQVMLGEAVFPAEIPLPESPFSLEIEGFTLEVSQMKLFPNQAATAVANLLLPESISKGKNCERASIDLGEIMLTQNCEFFKNNASAKFGVWNVGNTGLAINGVGYVADFSTKTGTAPGGISKRWKGLILVDGESKQATNLPVVSNTGYLQAGYHFANAAIVRHGLSAKLSNEEGFRYTTIQPYDYMLAFEGADLVISNNRIQGGNLNSVTLHLPEVSVRDFLGQRVFLDAPNLLIGSDLSVTGTLEAEAFAEKTFFWGEYGQAGNEITAYGAVFFRQGIFYTPGKLEENYYPLHGDQFLDIGYNEFKLEDLKARGVHGLTLNRPQYLFVQSPDLPNADQAHPFSAPFLIFEIEMKKKTTSWINFGARGVNAAFYADDIAFFEQSIPLPQRIGNPAAPLYLSDSSFVFTGLSKINLGSESIGENYGSIELQFVESATFHSDIRGALLLPAPTNSALKAKEIVFTSTAHISGGKIDLSEPARLEYWGLDIVQRPGYTSAGVLSVKTGQIILTAAGFSEPRHFAEPFYVHWAELLADGSVGRMFFDYHTAGQKFDGFNFSPEAIALSPYNPAQRGFLRVGGTAYLPFFGEDYLHIVDTYDTNIPGHPFNARRITLSDDTVGAEFFPTDKKIAGNWADGTAEFDFDIEYNVGTQNGFVGTGLSTLASLTGGTISSGITLTAENSCISFSENQTRSFSYAPASDITAIRDIWGCVCISDDRIENMVFGGSVTNSNNFLMVGSRTGQFAQLIVRETPTISQFTIDGQATLSAALSVDVLVNGHFSMLYNKAEDFIEGEVSGLFRTAAGVVFAGNSLRGQGQANWHISFGNGGENDYQSIQGSIALEIMSFTAGVSPTPPFIHTAGAGSGLDAGFYFGWNAPKSEAWVIQGGNPRYQFNMSALPDRLSGVYGFVQVKDSRNFFLFSGGYEVFAGLGAFVLPNPGASGGLGGVLLGPGLPYGLGNLGGRLYGEILGGFVSASAFFNLQLLTPPPTFHFQGTVGLEGCVLWVACKSVSLTVGLNSNDGFFID